MYFQSLTLNDDDGPRRIGSLARLTCTVRGTERTEVRWYKDGARINITRTSLFRWEGHTDPDRHHEESGMIVQGVS